MKNDNQFKFKEGEAEDNLSNIIFLKQDEVKCAMILWKTRANIYLGLHYFMGMGSINSNSNFLMDVMNDPKE